MEENILKNLLLRPGMEGREELLKALIAGCVQELKEYLNYKSSETLPDECAGIVSELVLIRINMDGVQGISSESQSSGGSATYLTDLPKDLKRRIHRYRKLAR